MSTPKVKPINAIIVRLAIKKFSNSREDRPITNEVKLSKKLGAGAGKWMKYKLPKDCLKPIEVFSNAARVWNYEHTLPWENGSRLLLISNLEKYNAWASE